MLSLCGLGGVDCVSKVFSFQKDTFEVPIKEITQ